MKKIISIFLCFAFLMMVLTGCESVKKSEADSSKNDSSAVLDDSGSENKEESDNSESVLTNTYKVPTKEMYIDYCYHKIEEAYTQVFLVDNVKFVAFSHLYEEKGTDAKAAYNDTYASFEYAMENYVDVNKLNIEEDRTVNINGIEAYEFKGTMNYQGDDELNGYFCGYSFVFDGFPCSIIGGVSDLDQPKAEIDEIKKVVEQMMYSVRSEF